MIIAVSAIGLFIVICAVLKSKASPAGQPKTKLQKRAEIIAGYKCRMDEVLSPYLDDKEALQTKKTQLLREFSIEVSNNIFFDADEVRKVIRELAQYGTKG